MSTYIDLNIFNNLSNDLINNIKIIYVFGYKVTEVLIVTKDDKCYGFGQNSWGALGLGHNRQEKEPKMIEELCFKQIIDFANGLHHVMALTSDGKVYSWGRNDLGFLGNGSRDCDFNKPQINEYFKNEVIVDMSCGACHSLVLTQNSEVYVWGYNGLGQIGNGSEELFQLIPIKLNDFNGEKVIAISCGFNHSMALTNCGHVFSWGCNEFGQLGLEEGEEAYNIFKTEFLTRNKPKEIKVVSEKNTKVFIVKISCGLTHSLLLSRDGDIYAFGHNGLGHISNNCYSDQIIPRKLYSEVKYSNIVTHFRYDISIAQSIDSTFYIKGNCGEEVIKTLRKISFESINSIFLNYFQITHKPIKIFCDYQRKNKSGYDFEIKNKRIFKILFCKKRLKNLVLKDLNLTFSPDIISKYRNNVRCKTDLDEEIKISFFFHDYDIELPWDVFGWNAIIVTENDKAFAIGSNNNGLIGFSHRNAIKEPFLVDFLCYKKIKNLDSGIEHVIARTEDNEIYIWGYNYYGELGNGTNVNCLEPQILSISRNERIVDMCCGSFHSIVLLESGEIYTWGSNVYGQIGNKSNNNLQLTPFKFKLIDKGKIIAISCGSSHSLALSDNGYVYSWGRNIYGQLGIENIMGSNEPKLIKLKDETNAKIFIGKIVCGHSHSLLLSREGDIYGFGSNSFGQLGNKYWKKFFHPRKVLSEKKFIEIASHRNCEISIALSIDGIFYIWGNCGQEIIYEPKETQFNSFNQIFLNYFDITYNRNNSEHRSYDKSLIETKQSGEYHMNFVEFNVISFGTYGIVSKAKHKNQNEISAIKKVAINDKFNDNSILRELKILFELKSEYIVELKNAWIEENYLLKEGFEKYEQYGIESDHRCFDQRNHLLLHIQMELCFKTLKDIIKQKNVRMTRFCYYIFSELLIEILESVDFLHKQDRPIIHRDLKPSNILITFGINGRFAKLADFGLAQFHEFNEQSHSEGVGTFKYMAPEISNSKHYDMRADVYSLGVIVQEIFDYNEVTEAKTDTQQMEKHCKVMELSEKMKTKNPELRPNCETILNEKYLWSLSLSDIENDEKFAEIRNQSFCIDEKFDLFFIRKKYELFKPLK